jgi:hypothetical protein
VKQTFVFYLLNSSCTSEICYCFDRFVNIEPSAVEEVAQDPNDVLGASLSNSSIDEKILSTEVGSNVHTLEEESTKLRITNISEGEYGLKVGY